MAKVGKPDSNVENFTLSHSISVSVATKYVHAMGVVQGKRHSLINFQSDTTFNIFLDGLLHYLFNDCKLSLIS